MHARKMDSIGQGRKTCDEQVERLVKIFSPGVNGFRVVVVINCWIIPLIPSVFPTPLPRIILILAAMATLHPSMVCSRRPPTAWQRRPHAYATAGTTLAPFRGVSPMPSHGAALMAYHDGTPTNVVPPGWPEWWIGAAVVTLRPRIGSVRILEL
jgi:hypothetical protein